MANPFKSFTPFRVMPEAVSWFIEQVNYQGDGLTAKLPAKPPHGQLWRTIGLARIGKYEDREFILEKPFYDDLCVYLMMVRFHERILPGVVIKEAMRPLIDKLKRDEDRDLTRQELAQIRDEVEGELLPKAFIRVTDVPVILIP